MSRRALALALVLASSRAQAEPLDQGPFHLDWSVPAGCPSAEALRERIEALLGVPIADLRPEPLSASGTVTEVDFRRFRLELETFQRAQRFTRSMEAPSCAELADAGALVLALAIDPTLAERQARANEDRPGEASAAPADLPELPPPLPAPLPSEESRPPPAAKPNPSAAERASWSPDWALGLGLLADLGSVGSTGFGPRATLAAGWGAARAELSVSWLPPVRSLVTRGPDRGGDIDLVAAELGGCFLPWRGALELAPCAEVEAGRLHGAGFGTEVRSSGVVTWFAAGATARAFWRATQAFHLRLGAGALARPQPLEFTLENVGVVHRVPWLLARFELGVEAEFE